MDKFGPNASQVRQFLRGLKTLSPEAWRLVPGDSALAKAAHGRHGTYQPEAIVKHAYGRDDWINPPLAELQKMQSGLKLPDEMTTHEAFGYAGEAVIGLAVCGELSFSEFAARYGGFYRAIPTVNLGPGQSPPLSQLPETVAERFLRRVQALHGPDWDSIFHIDAAMNGAFGIEHPGKALDAAVAAIEAVDDRSLAARVLDLLDQEGEAFCKWQSAVRSVAGFLERTTSLHSDWGDQVKDRIETQQQNAKKIAIRALAALLA